MNSICFDTETTGLHPNGSDPDEILTISIIGRDGSVLLDERFRPTVKTEWPHASAVNGIYPEGVADLPTIETAIPRLREIFAGADEVIGYNVGFDLGFLSAVGVRPREDARITDTMKEFTWFMGRRYKLVDAADHIGYEWTGRAHGSLADALATLAVQRWLEQWLVKSCFSHALIFAAQVCAIYVVILLSGLLVFWSAIFIDSKGRKFSRQEDSRILRKHHREIGKTMAINRVTIMGNLTRDAELRKKGDATSVLTFGLAINEKKKDSETGEYVDAPVFVDCALFGARAEALAPYLTKGKKVSVDGRLRYHSWMKNDEKRHALSVLVTDIEFADSKGAGKDTVSAQGQFTEPETYDADIPF